MTLNHSLSQVGDSLTVKLSGDFTFSENVEFRTIVEAVAVARPKEVLVDLSGLGAVDSAALSMLMVLRDRVGKTGGTVILRQPSAQVARIFEVVDFGKLFTIVS
jgi:anti-anti-sigma factor